MLAETRFEKFLQWGFESLIVGAIILGVTFLQDISKTMGNINTQMAVLIERTDGHQRVLDNHEARLRQLEASK